MLGGGGGGGGVNSSVTEDNITVPTLWPIKCCMLVRRIIYHAVLVLLCVHGIHFLSYCFQGHLNSMRYKWPHEELSTAACLVCQSWWCVSVNCC